MPSRRFAEFLVHVGSVRKASDTQDHLLGQLDTDLFHHRARLIMNSASPIEYYCFDSDGLALDKPCLCPRDNVFLCIILDFRVTGHRHWDVVRSDRQVEYYCLVVEYDD